LNKVADRKPNKQAALMGIQQPKMQAKNLTIIKKAIKKQRTAKIKLKKPGFKAQQKNHLAMA